MADTLNEKISILESNIKSYNNDIKNIDSQIEEYENFILEIQKYEEKVEDLFENKKQVYNNLGIDSKNKTAYKVLENLTEGYSTDNLQNMLYYYDDAIQKAKDKVIALEEKRNLLKSYISSNNCEIEEYKTKLRENDQE